MQQFFTRHAEKESVWSNRIGLVALQQLESRQYLFAARTHFNLHSKSHKHTRIQLFGASRAHYWQWKCRSSKWSFLLLLECTTLLFMFSAQVNLLCRMVFRCMWMLCHGDASTHRARIGKNSRVKITWFRIHYVWHYTFFLLQLWNGQNWVYVHSENIY